MWHGRALGREAQQESEFCSFRGEEFDDLSCPESFRHKFLLFIGQGFVLEMGSSESDVPSSDEERACVLLLVNRYWFVDSGCVRACVDIGYVIFVLFLVLYVEEKQLRVVNFHATANGSAA